MEWGLGMRPVLPCYQHTVLHLQTWFTHKIKQLTIYIAMVTCPTHLFLPYLCRRWCNSECTQMSIRIHSHAQRVPAAWVQAHWSIQGSVGMIYWDILCLDTKNTNKNTNLYIVHPHTHTHTLDSLRHMLVGTTHESRSAHDIHTVHIIYGSLTFTENAWFNAQGSDVQEGLLYPSLYAVPTLNKTAATWQYTSPRLKFQMQDVYHMIIRRKKIIIITLTQPCMYSVPS